MKRSFQRVKRGAAPVQGRSAVVAAALSLPGVWIAPPAYAETAPEKGIVAFKYLQYEDSQSGFNRIKVKSPSLYLLAPIGTEWSIEGSAVVDSLSGATPRWQTAVSSASVMHEERKAGDIKVTRYFERSSYSLGVSASNEHDYASKALSLNGSWSSDDNNTTWNLGAGGASDRIDPTGGGVPGVSGKTKHTAELVAGVTRVVTGTDVVQVNMTYGTGHGYYDDPYKLLDTRPDKREQLALLGRWNHYLVGDQSSLRASYRFYRDSFGIIAHTLQGEWAKPVYETLIVTPSIRLYTQSAANFYAAARDDGHGSPVFPDVQPGQLNSGDQRLSAFGAVALALKLEYRIDAAWTMDAKFEGYEQRANWRVGGSGSVGLDPFQARYIQLGVSRKF